MHGRVPVSTACGGIAVQTFVSESGRLERLRQHCWCACASTAQFCITKRSVGRTLRTLGPVCSLPESKWGPQA